MRQVRGRGPFFGEGEPFDLSPRVLPDPRQMEIPGLEEQPERERLVSKALVVGDPGYSRLRHALVNSHLKTSVLHDLPQIESVIPEVMQSREETGTPPSGTTTVGRYSPLFKKIQISRDRLSNDRDTTATLVHEIAHHHDLSVSPQFRHHVIRTALQEQRPMTEQQLSAMSEGFATGVEASHAVAYTQDRSNEDTPDGAYLGVNAYDDRPEAHFGESGVPEFKESRKEGLTGRRYYRVSTPHGPEGEQLMLPGMA